VKTILEELTALEQETVVDTTDQMAWTDPDGVP